MAFAKTNLEQLRSFLLEVKLPSILHGTGQDSTFYISVGTIQQLTIQM